MSLDNIKIVGGNGQRQKWDFYPTPPRMHASPGRLAARTERIDDLGTGGR